MKLSEQTRNVLKNFASINQNLLVKEGSEIATMSQMKNIVANATIPDSFPKEFAIYDLNEFLAALSLFSEPDLDFGENSVTISEGSNQCRYFYSDPSVVTTVTKQLKMPSQEVEFTLTKAMFKQIMNASATLGVQDLVLKGVKGGSTDIRITDKKNDTSNSFSLSVSDTCDADYEFYFKVENLKLLSGDYKVQVSSKGISFFQNLEKEVNYFIALEPESSYNA